MKKIKSNIGIVIVLLISLILHILTIVTLGYNYNLNSDDLSYIASGIHFFETGQVSMHGVISAQIMPGMPWLISVLVLLLGKGEALIIGLKILWMIMGLLSIFGVYKTICLFAKKQYGVIGSIFFLAIDFIWMDNLILTETPFMMGFIFLLYNSLALAKYQKNKYFYFIVIWYLFCLLLKANIAIYPIFLIIYLLLKKYDKIKLCKQLVIAMLCVLCFIIPWTIRNYNLYDKFIPLTYGSGNPLLLGTYQGYGCPADDEKAYQKYIDENMSKKIKLYKNDKDYLKKYYSLESDKLIAEYRMNEWWKNNKKDMLYSYFIYKPKIVIVESFYWERVFNIPAKAVLVIRYLDIFLSILASIAIIATKKYWKELLFLLMMYFSQVAIYSYTFAFDRYGQTLLPIRFVIIGIGLSILIPTIKNKIRKRSN